MTGPDLQNHVSVEVPDLINCNTNPLERREAEVRVSEWRHRTLLIVLAVESYPADERALCSRENICSGSRVLIVYQAADDAFAWGLRGDIFDGVYPEAVLHDPW